jgi:hypothetical protein
VERGNPQPAEISAGAEERAIQNAFQHAIKHEFSRKIVNATKISIGICNERRMSALAFEIDGFMWRFIAARKKQYGPADRFRYTPKSAQLHTYFLHWDSSPQPS